MSQLEMLANKKKLNKKSDSISIERSEVPIVQQKEASSVESKRKSSRRKSTSTVSIDSSDYRKERKKADKENKTDSTRRQKAELLFKLNVLVEKSKGKFNVSMSMNNTLDEIQNEFTRVKSALDNESMVKFCKYGLILGIKGIELANTQFDPLGVDLNGWSDSMAYTMETAEYDEVLGELYEKYKGSGSVSPEIRLLFMILMSGAMYSFTQRAKSDPNMLSNIMGFMSPKKSQNVQQVPVQQQIPQQQMQQQQQQMQHQQQMQQQQLPIPLMLMLLHC